MFVDPNTAAAIATDLN